jgi:hypothetical protein
MRMAVARLTAAAEMAAAALAAAGLDVQQQKSWWLQGSGLQQWQQQAG